MDVFVSRSKGSKVYHRRDATTLTGYPYITERSAANAERFVTGTVPANTAAGLPDCTG